MILRAALLALSAGPALAQDAPAHAPCLQPREDLAAYVAAFEAEGWTLVEGEARAEALLGPGELHRLVMISRRTFGNIPPIEDRAAWEAEARAAGEEQAQGATVLTRGPAAAVLRVGTIGTDRHVTCILTAPDLPEADALIATEPTQLPTFAMAQAELPLPPGATLLHLVAYRYETPISPLLAGGEAVTVTLVMGKAP